MLELAEGITRGKVGDVRLGAHVFEEDVGAQPRVVRVEGVDEDAGVDGARVALDQGCDRTGVVDGKFGHFGLEKFAISARVTVVTTADAAAVLDGSVRYGPGTRAHEQI